MEALIQQFLYFGDGSGFGDGDGSGSGDGSGFGDGDGSSFGYGDGDGLKSINGKMIYLVDGVETIFQSIKQNVAKGWILLSDLTQEETFIVKQGNLFAHGKTLRKAYASLNTKLFESLPVEDRIIEFNKTFKDRNKKYPALDFFEWHNKLTGSCEQGRKAFCQSKGIDLVAGRYTVLEFIELTKDSYEGQIIKQITKEGN